MKRIISLILSFCLIFSMVACSDTGNSNSGGDTDNPNNGSSNPDGNPTTNTGFEVIFFDIENAFNDC